MDEKQEVQGWKDVRITVDMPVSVLINFMNILNSRLCAVENLTTTLGPDGKLITLTDLYRLQVEEEQKQQAQKEAEASQGE